MERFSWEKQNAPSIPTLSLSLSLSLTHTYHLAPILRHVEAYRPQRRLHCTFLLAPRIQLKGMHSVDCFPAVTRSVRAAVHTGVVVLSHACVTF